MASTANQYALANNLSFQSRLDMKLLRHSMYVLALDPAPTDGSVELARRIVGMSGSGGGGMSSTNVSGRLARIVATDPPFSDEVTEDVSGATITDLSLESAVATHFLKLA